MPENPPESVALAVPTFVKASAQLSVMLGIEAPAMLATIKAQCFKGTTPDKVTDAQLAAFVSTAVSLQLNPLLPGMLYAYPERNGGITPIIGPDGVLKKLDEFISTAKLDGYECTVYPEDVTQRPTHATAKIYRPNNPHPSTYTALFSEWAIDSNPNWKIKPRHMLWLRALKQCARQVIHGLPMDADERQLAEMLNVTPADQQPASEPANPAPAETPKERAKAPTRSRRGAAAAAPVVEGELVPPAAPESPPPQPESVKPAAKPEQAQARTSLADKEVISCVCEVVEFGGIMVNYQGTKTASVKAEVRGGFNGIVYHFGGASVEGNAVKPFAAWQLEKPVRLSLQGKLNTKDNTVLVSVQKIELEAPAEKQMEVG